MLLQPLGQLHIKYWCGGKHRWFPFNGVSQFVANLILGDESPLHGSIINLIYEQGIGHARHLLQAAGLDQTDVNVVNMEAPLHLSALRSGRVGAAVSYEPVAGLLRAAGYKDIFDSRQMPGDIVDVLVVRASVLQARSAQVDALLAGWQRGLLALQERPEAAARLLAPGVEISPEDYLATLRKLTFYSAEQSLEQLSGVPPVLAQDALRLVTTLQAVGMIKVAPDWSRLLDPEPALRLQARKGGA